MIRVGRLRRVLALDAMADESRYAREERLYGAPNGRTAGSRVNLRLRDFDGAFPSQRVDRKRDGEVGQLATKSRVSPDDLVKGRGVECALSECELVEGIGGSGVSHTLLIADRAAIRKGGER